VRAYIFVILLLLAIFAAIGGYLYQRFSAFANIDFSPPPVTIAASIAITDNWDTHLDTVGTIKAVHGVELTSETSGEITAIHFDSGQNVNTGQLLLVLNDEIEQASKQNQIASLDLAEILFKRDSQLIAQKSIPQTQFDRSRADLARAQAQLAETEARLSNKRIEAPFAGTMGIRRVNVGDYLAPGTLIATLQDVAELEIDFTLPAQQAPRLKPGQEVRAKVNAFPGRRFKATITAIDSRVDPGTRNILVRAKLSDAEGLVPGMFATLQVDLNRTEPVVTVPETALTYSLQGNTIYIIAATEDGGLTAEAKIVKVGAVRDGRISIISGVSAGERVATAGQNKLYRGVRILVDESIDL
jgi:membrane fusion protein (multidrug efflux system)